MEIDLSRSVTKHKLWKVICSFWKILQKNPWKENVLKKQKNQNKHHVKGQRPIVLRGQMALNAADHFETFTTGNSDSWAMARFVLARPFSLLMGRKRAAQSLRRSTRWYPGVYQASARKSFEPFRRSSTFESLHCGMAEIFHAMFIFTHAFWTIGNEFTSKKFVDLCA